MNWLYSGKRSTKLSRQKKQEKPYTYYDPRTSNAYNEDISEHTQTASQLLRYLLDSVVLPTQHVVYSLVVPTESDPNAYVVSPEMQASVAFYENQRKDGLPIDIGEVPMVFVTVNRTGHSSLIFLSGLTESFPGRLVFSLGLLQSDKGINFKPDVASVAQHVPRLKQYYEGVLLQGPDFTNNIFGQKGTIMNMKLKKYKLYPRHCYAQFRVY
jgi:hypothetical protein